MLRYIGYFPPAKRKRPGKLGGVLLMLRDRHLGIVRSHDQGGSLISSAGNDSWREAIRPG